MPIDERENRGGRYGGRWRPNAADDPSVSLRGSEGTPAGPNDFDAASADIPIWGWLSGAEGRRDAAEAEAEAETNRNYWENLTGYMPSVDDLSADLASEDNVEGMGSEWDPNRETAEGSYGRGSMNDSMGALSTWAEGGFTDADRAMMAEASRGASMGARADREASLSALEARGMGGSGSSLAASLAADEGAASRASSMNTTMMGAAQARQIEANAARAALGGTMRDMDARERSGREAYNNRETDYSRGREDRNTDRENTSRENDAEAAQTVYTNRERATAGATNQYSTDVNSRAGANAREDDRNEGLLSALGEIL